MYAGVQSFSTEFYRVQAKLGKQPRAAIKTRNFYYYYMDTMRPINLKKNARSKPRLIC